MPEDVARYKWKMKFYHVTLFFPFSASNLLLIGLTTLEAELRCLDAFENDLKVITNHKAIPNSYVEGCYLCFW